jgi:hypothetical protein
MMQKKLIAIALLALAVFASSAFAQNANRGGTVFASAARTATVTGGDLSNDVYRGVHVIVDVTVAPGGDTITPKIQGKDPTSLKYYDILVGAAISATGTTVLKVYPSISPSANASAQDLLPQTWRVVVTHSAGTSFTYSVGYNADY